MKNNYRIEGNTVYIELKYKDQKLEMLVSVEDLPKLETYPNKIYSQYDKSIDGFYAAGKMNQKPFRFHRWLIDCPEGLTVDHLNHNTLDNRRENLSIKTNKENCNNRKGAYRTSKTGIKNLFYCNTWKRYIIEIDKKQYGRFKTLEEARERIQELKREGAL